MGSQTDSQVESQPHDCKLAVTAPSKQALSTDVNSVGAQRLQSMQDGMRVVLAGSAAAVVHRCIIMAGGAEKYHVRMLPLNLANSALAATALPTTYTCTQHAQPQNMGHEATEGHTGVPCMCTHAKRCTTQSNRTALIGNNRPSVVLCRRFLQLLAS